MSSGDQPSSTIKAPNGLSFHITATIDPKDNETFLEAFRTVYHLVAAEPECVFIEVFQSPEQPGVFKWVEHWYRTALLYPRFQFLHTLFGSMMINAILISYVISKN